MLKKIQKDIKTIYLILGKKKVFINLLLCLVSVVPYVLAYSSSKNVWECLLNFSSNKFYVSFIISVLFANIIFLSSATKNSNFLSRFLNYKDYLKDLIRKIFVLNFLLLGISHLMALLPISILLNFNFNITEVTFYTIPLPIYYIFFLIREYIFIALLTIIIGLTYQFKGKELSCLLSVIIVILFNFDIEINYVDTLIKIPLTINNYFHIIDYSNFFLEITASFVQFYIYLAIISIIKYYLFKKKVNYI